MSSWMRETNPEMVSCSSSLAKALTKLLVVFEELGGNPSKLSLVKRTLSGVCADVFEYHPMIKNWHIESYGRTEGIHIPKIHLWCNPGQSISSIKFASFRTLLETCGTFQHGTCHAPNSYAILQNKCVGQERCSLAISNTNFKQDPCRNVLKRLSVKQFAPLRLQSVSRGANCDHLCGQPRGLAHFGIRRDQVRHIASINSKRHTLSSG